MKRILVLSAVCSRKYYEKLCSTRTKPALDTQQKFMTSIIEGLAQQDDVSVHCISVVPISRSNSPQRVHKELKETIDNISYRYVEFRNLPIVKNLSAARSMKRAVKEFYYQYRDEGFLVLADTLSVEASEAAMWLKSRGVCVTAIVTDIPLIAETMGGSRGLHGLYSRYYGEKANNLLLKYDKYILLSEHMNEIVNQEKKKPYMIMECIVDENAFDGVVEEMPLERPAIMYAGKFYRECGVIELASASSELKDLCDVWLYGGHGDCIKELEELSKHNSNLYVHDIVPVSEILRLEKKCTLLINPRFAEEEFSKYSFPSKTAEYMLSGTPVMMYRLPSLPIEYEDYLYLIDEYDTSLAQAIRAVLNIPELQRLNKGKQAKEFIIQRKNKTYQAKRILHFLMSTL